VHGVEHSFSKQFGMSNEASQKRFIADWLAQTQTCCNTSRAPGAVRRPTTQQDRGIGNVIRDAYASIFIAIAWRQQLHLRACGVRSGVGAVDRLPHSRARFFPGALYKAPMGDIICFLK
jgi:hypothetical protein